jgi:hypothetical protein
LSSFSNRNQRRRFFGLALFFGEDLSELDPEEADLELVDGAE